MRYLLVLAGVMLMAAVEARELGGLTLPEEAEVGGERLLLNGAGIRSKFFVKVYVAGLYLTRPASDLAAVIAPDAPKRVSMYFLRDVGRSQLAEAWREGFAANAGPAGAAGHAQRIGELAEFMGDVAEGDEVLLDYLPGQGTRVTVAGTARGILAGKDFNDALLAVWLGEAPVTPELKAGLLGR